MRGGGEQAFLALLFVNPKICETMTHSSRSALGDSPHLQRIYENALRDSAFVRSLLDLSDDCVKILDLEGRLELMSPGGLRVMEIDDFTPFQSCRWLDFWNGPHAEDAQAALDDARAGRTGRFRGYANTAKGNRRYWDVKIIPIFDAEGKPRALTSISRDITRQQELEEQAQENLAEMRHRAKNVLTIVQSIASQTLRAAGAEFSPISRTFSQRLQALARSYDALILRDWASASLSELVTGTLAPFDDEGRSRIEHVGPDVTLAATSAMTLALALNELATNAAKYGALSNESGRVKIEWELHGNTKRLHMVWREHGGPPVAPPKRRGFGSALIDRALPGELGGSVSIHFHPTGVVCEIETPILET